MRLVRVWWRSTRLGAPAVPVLARLLKLANLPIVVGDHVMICAGATILPRPNSTLSLRAAVTVP